MTKRGRKGRPRKNNVKRKPSGRISSTEAENPMKVAIEARQRIHGLPEDLARDQMAGSVLGRLRLAGDITEPQYDAGDKFRKEHAEMLRAIQARDGLEQHDATGNAFEWELDSKNPETDQRQQDYITWAIGAVARHRVAKDRLNVIEWFAIQRVVIEDKEPMAFMPLESALTALALGYGMVKLVKA